MIITAIESFPWRRYLSLLSSRISVGSDGLHFLLSSSRVHRQYLSFPTHSATLTDPVSVRGVFRVHPRAPKPSLALHVGLGSPPVGTISSSPANLAHTLDFWKVQIYGLKLFGLSTASLKSLYTILLLVLAQSLDFYSRRLKVFEINITKL